MNCTKTCSWQLSCVRLWFKPTYYTNIWTSHKFRLRTSRSLSHPKWIPSKIDSQPLGIEAFSVSHQLHHLLKQTEKLFICDQCPSDCFAHIRLKCNVLILTANTNILVKSVSKDHSVQCKIHLPESRSSLSSGWRCTGHHRCISNCPPSIATWDIHNHNPFKVHSGQYFCCLILDWHTLLVINYPIPFKAFPIHIFLPLIASQTIYSVRDWLENKSGKDFHILTSRVSMELRNSPAS